MTSGKRPYVVILAMGLCLAPWSARAGVGAHTDSPNLRLKPRRGVQERGVPSARRRGVRRGAPQLVARSRLVARGSRRPKAPGRGGARDTPHPLGPPSARVAQLAIHLDRDVNEKGLVLNRQDHLAPVLGLARPARPRCKTSCPPAWALHLKRSSTSISCSTTRCLPRGATRARRAPLRGAPRQPGDVPRGDAGDRAHPRRRPARPTRPRSGSVRPRGDREPEHDRRAVLPPAAHPRTAVASSWRLVRRARPSARGLALLVGGHGARRPPQLRLSPRASPQARCSTAARSSRRTRSSATPRARARPQSWRILPSPPVAAAAVRQPHRPALREHDRPHHLDPPRHPDGGRWQPDAQHALVPRDGGDGGPGAHGEIDGSVLWARGVRGGGAPSRPEPP